MLAIRMFVVATAVAALLSLPTGTVSAAEATLLRDIRPGGGSDPRTLVRVEDRVFFSAADGTHGRELWVTDGTSEGTKLVKDVRPGAISSQPSTLTAVGSRLYFTANDGSHGRELWVSDGTAAGTHLVKDMTTGRAGTWTLGIAGVGDTAYFDVVGDGLYRSDGTARGTRLVHAFKGIGLDHAVVKGSRLFFPAVGPHVDTSAGALASTGWASTLWKTDGTTSGTRRLAPKDLSVAWLVKHAGRVYFEASTPSPTGLDVPPVLWRSDGTRAGTRQLSSAYLASTLERLGGSLWFDASSSPFQESIRLYHSDGTASGTGPVRPRIPNLRDMVPAVGLLWAHRHSSGVPDPDELWAGDGTAVGTHLVYGGTGDWFVGDWGSWECVGLAGRVYFAASPGGADHDWELVDTELWTSDGTSDGTYEAVDIDPGGSSDPRALIRLGGSLLFSAGDGQHGRELWRLDP
jgi:ELWxxDGT repeat protein